MDLVAFLPSSVLAVLLISASPRPAMALILRRAAVRGMRAAVSTVLTLLQVVPETFLYIGLAAVVGHASAWLRMPRIRRRLEAASGTVLIGLGVGVAATPS